MPFEELKERHATVWSAGAYHGITETITDIHAEVIERLRPEPGQRFLDLACGTGAVAELAAPAGADVVGIDLAPALVEQAKGRADERGLEIDYRVGDVEALELEDASFDRVASTCGVMFAPDHPAIARELARVTRPTGRIALACWTPESGLAQLFGVMREFQPPPPPGVATSSTGDGRTTSAISSTVISSWSSSCWTARSSRSRAKQCGSSSAATTARPRCSPTRSTTTSGRSCIGTSSSSTSGRA